ncbi:MAG: ABC transporter substrate-binding protein [Thermodesulfobacteriota bacterium]
MKTFPRRIFYLLWLLALLLLTACSSKENSDNHPATGDPGNILRIDVDCDFGLFNPHKVGCSGSTLVFPFIFSFLCVQNTAGELEPDLAAAWDYDPKTFTWRIRLRDDARFHNGEPVTADDALFSIRSTIENRDKSLGNIIDTMQAINSYALEIRLKRDDPSFLKSIWDIEIIPSPARQASLNPDESPIGSGPFKFVSRTDDGRVVLSANENYYNGRPAIDRVVLYYIPDREASWIRLIKGQTDVVGNLTFKDYKIIEQYTDRFYFSQALYPYYTILLYNTRHPLFETPMVRRALTQAIDRDYIVQNILNGLAEVIAGPMGNGSIWHDPDLKPLPYDPAHALELL